MFSRLYIEYDPLLWTLEKPTDAQRISESVKALPLIVTYPLKGTLLLSPRAGRVVLFPDSGPILPAGWIPGDVTLTSTCLYLPSVSVPAGGPVLYSLSDATASGLEDQLTDAMTDGKPTTVPFSWGTSNGEMVLNGDVLPFAVIVAAVG
jgi:hypothetical protein